MARTKPNEAKQQRVKSSGHSARVGSSRGLRLAGILNSAIWVVIVAGLFGTGLFISLNGDDTFRYPKELVFRAEAILLSTLFVLFLIFEPAERPLRNIPKTIWYLTGAIVVWTIVSTIASTNVRHSVASVGWVVCAVIVFLFTYDQLRSRDLRVVWWAIVPAIVNAVVVVMQSFAGVRPIPLIDTAQERIATTGLVGNPDDVGAYLVLPALAAVALLITYARPILPALALLILLAALVATHTLTALLAFAVGVSFLLVLRGKHPVRVVILIAIVAFSVTLFYAPLRNRAVIAKNQIASGNYDQAVSYRLGSTLAAVEMFLDRPLFGTGPDTFRSQYFGYKMRVDEKYAGLLNTWSAESRANVEFTEAHNDHVEVLAEAGLPGYVLMLTSFVLLARWTSGSESPTNNGRFARYLAPALTAGTVVIALGFFPLQIASTLNSLLFFAATVMAWQTE